MACHGSYEETHAFGLGRAAEPVAARPLSIPTTKNVNRAFSNTMTLRSTKNRARRAVALTRISSAGRAHASASDSAGIASDRSIDRCTPGVIPVRMKIEGEPGPSVTEEGGSQMWEG